MIKQIIGGVTKKTVYAEMSEADATALMTLMEGKLETYEKKFEGGTKAALPSKMNAIRFSAGKEVSKGVYQTTTVNVPHITSGKSHSDCKALVIGAFDCAYDLSVKCEYSNLVGSKS